PWWPQRDSNPWLVAVTFPPAVSQSSWQHASWKGYATKTRSVVKTSSGRSSVQISGPQLLAGKQVAAVQLRISDLRPAGRDPPLTHGSRLVHRIGDLRTFVPIPYAARPGQGHGHPGGKPPRPPRNAAGRDRRRTWVCRESGSPRAFEAPPPRSRP